VVRLVNSLGRLLEESVLYLSRPEAGLRPEQIQTLNRLRESDAALEGKTVLIVDDDVRNIFALTSALESRRVNVIHAETGRACLATLESTPDIDVVLMDIMMPEMDGFQTIAAIRTIPRLAALPIVALTAKAMKGDRAKCLQAGASDYVTKPVDLEHLFSVLRVSSCRQQERLATPFTASVATRVRNQCDERATCAYRRPRQNPVGGRFSGQPPRAGSGAGVAGTGAGAGAVGSGSAARPADLGLRRRAAGRQDAGYGRLRDCGNDSRAAVENSIKYRRDVPPVIRIRCERTQDSIVLSVSDNGIGIAAEYLESIFGAFKRLHTHAAYAGAGIGLSLCQRIAEKYRGKIWAESTPGEGSSFFVRFPLEMVSEAREAASQASG
jgi:CheY-like chemotaxis protein